jgi:hypothetical protein
MKKLSALFLIIACSLTAFSKDVPNLIPFRKGDRWGYCDMSKNIVIECRYDDARPFHNSRAAVKLQGAYFFINTTGERVSGFYDEVEDFQEGCNVGRVKKDNYWMLIDRFGNELIDPTFLYIREFNHNCAWSVDSSSRKWILIDENGNTLNSFFYDCINDFEGKKTIAGIYENGKTQYEILKNNGQLFKSLQNKYDFVDGYSNGLAVARRTDSTYCYLGKSGKIKIDSKFKNALSFSEGIAVVVDSNWKTQAINKKGKVLFKIQYSSFYDAQYKCKRLSVYKGDKTGVIDDKGNLIIDFLYDAAMVSDGIIAVKSDEKWKFLDINGRPINEMLFDENREENSWVSYDVGYEFDGGLCRVIYNGKPGYMDRKGNTYLQD